MPLPSDPLELAALFAEQISHLATLLCGDAEITDSERRTLALVIHEKSEQIERAMDHELSKRIPRRRKSG